jgi:hypothetical protein
MQDARCRMGWCLPLLSLYTPWARFSKIGAWYRVPGPGYLAPGTRYRINAEDRTPSAEDRAGLPGNGKRAHPICRRQDTGWGVSPISILHLAYPVCGFSKREPGIPPGIGCQVPGTRCRIPTTWHLVPDTRYRINAEGRIPSTEDRTRYPVPEKPAHRLCILHPVRHPGPGTDYPSGTGHRSMPSREGSPSASTRTSSS